MAIQPVDVGAQVLADEMTRVAGVVLPFAAVLAAIAVGWRLVLRYLK